MNTITVKSKHHWFGNRYLEIKTLDGKLFSKKWVRTSTEQQGYDNMPKDQEMEFSDFENKANIDDIYQTFALTGCGPSYLEVENATPDEVMKLLYNTPLPKNLELVWFGQCGCNMGHCGAITSIETLDLPEQKTYQDLFKYFGEYNQREEGYEYYEYPDSVFLSLDKVTGDNEENYDVYLEPSGCYGKKTNIHKIFDQSKIYITYSYGR